MLMLIILVVLICALAGAFPRAGAYNEGWGYGPSGGLVLLMLILLALYLSGHRF